MGDSPIATWLRRSRNVMAAIQKHGRAKENDGVIAMSQPHIGREVRAPQQKTMRVRTDASCEKRQTSESTAATECYAL